MIKILLVEDEKVMAKNIAFFLEKESYSVEIAYDGETALQLFQKNTHDLVLLDWTLPKKDGLEVCKEIRKSSYVPIIMITAKGEIFDKVIGLEIGADDYLVKPFHQRELLARIHALLRRHQQPPAGQLGQFIQHDALTLDKDRMMLGFQNHSISLTATEYKLLDIMMSHPLHVYSRDYLFDEIWGDPMGFNDRSVDVNISRLRKKILDLTGKRYLQAIRGAGYRFMGEH
ncbi:MAG TPA: response regulator transcription factor [Bacilli bacterium]